MKVLVTGGAGFIGSHLVDKLIGWGYEVIAVDNLSNGKEENINEKASFLKGDIKEKEFCNDNIKDVDVVFHLAAEVDVRKGPDEPNLDFRENIVGIDQDFETPYGTRKILYADWIASGRLYQPIENKLNYVFNSSIYYLWQVNIIHALIM